MSLVHARSTTDLAGRVFLMAPNRWPSTCGRETCAHLQCIRVRDHARRNTCGDCGQLIAEGHRYVVRGSVLVHADGCPEVAR